MPYSAAKCFLKSNGCYQFFFLSDCKSVLLSAEFKMSSLIIENIDESLYY
ncbi:hypothetical protein ZONE111905_03490 [Zobellia nedashkovskayae]